MNFKTPSLVPCGFKQANAEATAIKHHGFAKRTFNTPFFRGNQMNIMCYRASLLDRIRFLFRGRVWVTSVHDGDEELLANMKKIKIGLSVQIPFT